MLKRRRYLHCGSKSLFTIGNGIKNTKKISYRKSSRARKYEFSFVCAKDAIAFAVCIFINVRKTQKGTCVAFSTW